MFLRLGGGESIIHDSMKRHIKNIIERDNFCLVSELEYRIPEINRITDYYFEVRNYHGYIEKIAVECVHRHTDIDEFRAKNEEYARVGINTLWLFNAEKFIVDYYYDENKPIEEHTYWKSEVRINEILKEAHTMYFGKVFTLNLNDNTMWGIHFYPVTRFVEPNEWGGGYEKTLKRTKEPLPQFIPRFKVTSFKISSADRYLKYSRAVAQPFVECFW